jgi:hypothetical protein
VEKSGRGESQNRFSPQLGKDAQKSAFSLRHLDAYNKVCEEKRTQPTKYEILAFIRMKNVEKIEITSRERHRTAYLPEQSS